MASITPTRDGGFVSASWTAEPKYAYIWAACTAPGYEQWSAVRSEAWEDKTLEWSGVPANAKVALMSPRMRGEQRVWRTIATADI
jgi:hypothetical protein